jgi:hypothetical protein
MGDTWIPDRAITLEEILHSYTLLEEDWKKISGDPDMRLQTTLTAMILVGGFLGGLRGEELLKLELGTIRKHWDEAIHHNTPPCAAGPGWMLQDVRWREVVFSTSGLQIQVRHPHLPLGSLSAGSLWCALSLPWPSLPHGRQKREGKAERDGQPGPHSAWDFD